MHTNHRAIVVRQLETPHKVALLDQAVGRIDAVITVPIPIGFMIDYTVKKCRGTIWYIDRYELIAVPFSIARADLLFWHHILELCYYFVPLGSFTQQLFELLEFLYTVDVSVYQCDRKQRLYLFRLLFMIGVHTGLPRISEKRLEYLRMLPLYILAHEVMSEHDEKMLGEWLRLCVYEHPALRKFNTTHFLIAK